MSFLFLMSLMSFARAQGSLVLVASGNADSTVVQGFAGEPLDVPAVIRARWRSSDATNASFTFQQLAGPIGDRQLTLDMLLISGVEQYLDQRIHFTKQGVTVDIPVPGLVVGIERMITVAAGHFGTAPVQLSEATVQQLARVSRIDWSKATFGVDGGQDQEKYLAIYYYVRAQRQELERQLRNDLLPLTGIDLLTTQSAERGDPGRMEPVPTVCSTVFDEKNFMCPLDLKVDSIPAVADVKLTDDLMLVIAAQARQAAASAQETGKVRKRDRWLKKEMDAINARIDKMDQHEALWALRDRLDDVEIRMDELGGQVAELRSAEVRPEQNGNAIADLSALTGRNIIIRFGVGSATLDDEQRRLLDEVAKQMADSRTDRALITGYADASGDPAANLVLSEQRAKAVRGRLLQQGIGPDRLLLNYYGASLSRGEGAADRRVEIAWLR